MWKNNTIHTLRWVFRWLSQCASPRPLHYSLHLQEAGWSSEAASRGTLMLLFKGRLAVSSSARPRPLPRPLRHHVQVWVLRTRPPRKIWDDECTVQCGEYFLHKNKVDFLYGLPFTFTKSVSDHNSSDLLLNEFWIENEADLSYRQYYCKCSQATMSRELKAPFSYSSNLSAQIPFQEVSGIELWWKRC